MSCPLYKSMKSKGTSFFAFPSAAEDINLAFSNPNYKLNFNKFVLINIPEQVRVSVNIANAQTMGVLNFIKDQTSASGNRFYNFDPTSTIPTKFSDQLVESLRNYVSNYDVTIRESRINVNTDFYTISETATPTEMIFWKWCRKYNLIDLEPAVHKTDWDKNLQDFQNEYGNDNDYFREYLWKEREVNYYDCTYTCVGFSEFQLPGLQDATLTVKINQVAKFRKNDTVTFSGVTTPILTGKTFTISSVVHSGNTTYLNLGGYYGNNVEGTTVAYLVYNKLIQYIGEVQAVSKVQTSRRNFTEVTAQIPHHCGATPTKLFKIAANTNYYPDLEMPILPQEQQEEIVGAENLNSPIRTNPQNYPGVFYGYFDTYDKTYKCSTGDKLRYSGDYYGVKLSNNIGLNVETYVEKLSDFDSSNIDGLNLDFDKEHYLKMNLPGRTIKNFDDFNSTYFGSAPSDFDFNAILWYYQIDDGSGKLQTNLYGIEFLNNPNDDDDNCDYTNQKITPYKKLVTNGVQDGTSYIFNFNINFDVDNDVLPVTYDPTTVYNQFGFDLYQNVLQTNALLQDNFMTIISGFTTMNEDLFNLRSIIYNQTDIDVIKSQIKNLGDLLNLYSTFQFQNSDTAKITTNFTGTYPTLQVDVINTKYSDIVDVNISNIFTYNTTNSGSAYVIAVPSSNQMLLNIYNDNNDINGTATILLNNDLEYKQALEIYIKPNLSESMQTLDLQITYNNGSTKSTQTLIGGIDLPVDLVNYDSSNPTSSTYVNSYYTNTPLSTYMSFSGNSFQTGSTTTIKLQQDLFSAGEYVYIDNFFVLSGTSIVDISGAYYITGYTNETYTIKAAALLNVDTNYMSLYGKPKISNYNGIKYTILRTNGVSTASITDRYTITKELL